HRLVHRRPPPRTLFPYTTLFRSKPHLEEIRKLTSLPICIGFGIKTPVDVKNLSQYANGVVVGSAIVKHIHENPNITALPAFIRSDRKSTRLNSSHVKISYAVFCL